jgi:hypothetical protein
MRNQRMIIAALALVALPLMANAEDAQIAAADPTLGGLLSDLRCTTRLDSYGYILDGETHAWLNTGRDADVGRAYTIKMADRTFCNNADCGDGKRGFAVGQVTNRVSYKEVRLTVDESEYAISIIGDATAPDAEIVMEVKSHPQSQGQALRSGVCQPI